MVGGKRVLKVEDGEEQTGKLSEGDYKRHNQRGTLCGQDEDSSDADVLSDAVA